MRQNRSGTPRPRLSRNSSSALFIPALSLLAAISQARAEVKLPALISDHMVLQRRAGAPVWGTAKPGEKVTVTLDGQSASVETGADGKWRVELNLADSPPGPFELVVKGTNELRVKDVAVGEVWVAAGQSNMQFTMSGEMSAREEIPTSENALLRHFKVDNVASETPLEDCGGAWETASPTTTGSFTAVGYYFGKAIQKELATPVGLINATWGGTSAEGWTRRGALEADPVSARVVREALHRNNSYAEERAKFAAGFGDWLRRNGRQDRRPAEVSAWTGVTIPPEGWVSVKVPGVVSVEGLPQSGALWMRKEIDLGDSDTKKDLNLNLGLIEGFEAVYWNGEFVGETTYETYPGTPYKREYKVPAAFLKPGPNILAVRIFCPAAPAKVSNFAMLAGRASLKGEWLVKGEYEFPPIDAKAAGPVPRAPRPPLPPQAFPGNLFAGMVNPLLPYAIRGVIWYQGEANASRAWRYRTVFPILISDWRAQWKEPELPFYFCQLPGYMAKEAVPGESRWAELREAQSLALRLPCTGQAVLIDLGEADDIHPLRKREAGSRLAAIALAKTYGRAIPFSGPVYQSMEVRAGKAHLTFAHTDGGLVAAPLPPEAVLSHRAGTKAPMERRSPGSELEGFAICGADRQWVWAEAAIAGNEVAVWSDKVPEPVAVRYAWADNPTCNLWNGAGFPASPFRTDNFPALTQGANQP